MHININSHPPKIDEHQYIDKRCEAAVIGISVLSSKIPIENDDIISSDRNRHGSGVACFIRNDLSYSTKSFLLHF